MTTTMTTTMTNKIEVSQRCCEWLATLEIFEMYCSLPPLVMTELIPNEQYDNLRDAINTILDRIETHLVCLLLLPSFSLNRKWMYLPS